MPDKKFSFGYIFVPIILLSFSGCIIVRKYQKNKPFVYKNDIQLNIDNISADEKVIIESRLNTQLDDSSRVRIKDVVFLLHYIDQPPAFDTFSAAASANNMELSMMNL